MNCCRVCAIIIQWCIKIIRYTFILPHSYHGEKAQHPFGKTAFLQPVLLVHQSARLHNIKCNNRSLKIHSSLSKTIAGTLHYPCGHVSIRLIYWDASSVRGHDQCCFTSTLTESYHSGTRVFGLIHTVHHSGLLLILVMLKHSLPHVPVVGISVWLPQDRRPRGIWFS